MGTNLSHQWDARAIAPGLEYFPETERAQRSAERQATDREDLEMERAGINIKRARFSSDKSEFATGEDKADKRLAQNAIMLELAASLATPSYRKAYSDFTRTSDTALRTADQLLLEMQEDYDRLLRDMKRLDENALHISGNRLAYVGEDGRYVDQYGAALSGADHEEAVAAHHANPDATTWKERENLQRDIETLEAEQQEIRQYVEDIEDLQRRAERGELSEEELQQARRDIVDQAPAALRERLEQDLMMMDEDADSEISFNDSDMFGRTTSFSKLDGGGITTATSLQGSFQLAATQPESAAPAPAADNFAPVSAPLINKPA